MTATPDDHDNPDAAQAADPRGETIGGLVARLVDDGKAYARAEIEMLKQVARHRARRAKTGAALLGIAILALLCALQALVLALVLGLATVIGPFGAGMTVFAILTLIGLLAARAGGKALSALGGGEDDQAAIVRGEQQP